MERIIDVHHHLLPQLYIDAVGTGPILDRARRAAPRVAIDWTAEKSLAEMDANNVTAAILSVSAPASGSATTRAPPRWPARCNDFTAGPGAPHPSRFGCGNAALALPDVEGRGEKSAMPASFRPTASA